MVFTMLGLFMKAYGWPRPPILIAVALGPVMERYLWIAVNNYGFSMVTRPQFLAILGVMGLVALAGVRMRRQADRAVEEVKGATVAASPGATLATAPPEPELAVRPIPAAKTSLRDRLTLEFFGEIVLLTLVAAFLGYMLWDSANWRFSDRLTPLIGIAIAAIFWMLRVGTIVLSFFRPVPISKRAPAIMDTGFDRGGNTPASRRRFLQIFGFTVGLILAVWVLGFHVGATVLLGAYLVMISRVSWFWTAIITLTALGILVGFYDWLLGIPWHVPLIVELFK
jgi:putative tricarboxylic transport membrane protein